MTAQELYAYLGTFNEVTRRGMEVAVWMGTGSPNPIIDVQVGPKRTPTRMNFVGETGQMRQKARLGRTER